jgi:uncharacterized protein (UPF0332 family)
VTKEEKRELKKKIKIAEQMLRDAKRKSPSHVVTVVRQTVPCWERMSSEDE